MNSYVLLAVVFRFAVDFLLLLAANHHLNRETFLYRKFLGAAIGGAHTALATMADFTFFAGQVWQIMIPVLMCMVSFGIRRDVLPVGLFFVLLRTSLDRLMVQRGNGEDIVWAALFLGLCLYGFRGGIGKKRLVPVELSYGEKTVRLQALWDTGNTLRDPVTGKPVLVVDSSIADSLLGLTPPQLQQPVESLGMIPGLRLIPYCGVGKSNGMLLGMHIKQTRIGRRKGSAIIAFAPHLLDEKGGYQGLLGEY